MMDPLVEYLKQPRHRVSREESQKSRIKQLKREREWFAKRFFDLFDRYLKLKKTMQCKHLN